jgi:hypothetical protein
METFCKLEYGSRDEEHARLVRPLPQSSGWPGNDEKYEKTVMTN